MHLALKPDIFPFREILIKLKQPTFQKGEKEEKLGVRLTVIDYAWFADLNAYDQQLLLKTHLGLQLCGCSQTIWYYIYKSTAGTSPSHMKVLLKINEEFNFKKNLALVKVSGMCS